ncbi:hypothetical protein ACSSAF_06480 [Staphylococcus succinus]|uniref:hypothetical protein n=1 Tax=Staphylococcus succinus TaxID=61015 RepID=UPI003F5AFCB4
MRTILSHGSSILVFGLALVFTEDFFYLLTIYFLAFCTSYMFWNKWIDAIKKTAKRANA